MGTAAIATTLIIIFFVVGAFIPFAQEAFAGVATSQGIDNLIDDISPGASIEDVTDDVSIGKVLISITKMFFWTFGDLPFWLDSFFILLRILLIVTLVMTFTGIGS